jgi:hypothetical protein
LQSFFVAQLDQLRNHTTSVALFAHAAAELQLLSAATLSVSAVVSGYERPVECFSEKWTQNII